MGHCLRQGAHARSRVPVSSLIASRLLLGCDEAGYGPNLGPLVIAGTLWQVPSGLEPEGAYRCLATLLGGDAARIRDAARGCPPARPWPLVADSKTLYRGPRRLEQLEQGVLAWLGTMGCWPASAWAAWRMLAPQAAPLLRSIPWYGEDFALPVAAERAAIDEAAAHLRTALAEARIGLVAIRARAIFEEKFNRLCTSRGTKAAVLSEATLGLIRRLLKPVAGTPIEVLCDKHGGRGRYTALISRFFPGQLVDVRAEGRTESRYWLGPERARLEFRFASKAERYVPVALASMVAKYLRELAMHALNRFWQARVSGLRPTAGYPRDARRFQGEIAAARQALGIPENALWRYR